MAKLKAVPYSKEEDAAILEVLALPDNKRKDAFAGVLTKFPLRNMGGLKYRALSLSKKAGKTTRRSIQHKDVKSVNVGATAIQLRTVEMVVPHLNDTQKLGLIERLLKG